MRPPNANRIIDDPRDIVPGGRVVDATSETRAFEADGLKQRFDPQVVLNPGRMWAEL